MILLIIGIVALIYATFELIRCGVNIRNCDERIQALYETALWRRFLDNWEKMKFWREGSDDHGQYYYFTYGKYNVFVHVKDRKTPPLASIFWDTRTHYNENTCLLSPFNERMSKELARRLMFRHLYHKDPNTGEIKFENHED